MIFGIIFKNVGVARIIKIFFLENVEILKLSRISRLLQFLKCEGLNFEKFKKIADKISI